MLSIVSVNVWIMNQNMLPISRRKPRPFCPISCTTTTGFVSMVPLESALRFSSAMFRWKLPQFPQVKRGKAAGAVALGGVTDGRYCFGPRFYTTKQLQPVEKYAGRRVGHAAKA